MLAWGGKAMACNRLCNPGRNEHTEECINSPDNLHYGAVCEECGRTVTNEEYSCGEAKCCHADVIPEESYR